VFALSLMVAGALGVLWASVLFVRGAALKGAARSSKPQSCCGSNPNDIFMVQLSLLTTEHTVGMQLLRDVPFTAIFWTLTEPIRASILAQTSPEDRTTRHIILANVSAASISGCIAAAVTTPFDVIKTQQQIATTSQTVWTTGQMLVQRRGWGVLYTGVWPRAMRAAPACAIVVSSYELLKRFLTPDATDFRSLACIAESDETASTVT
jgi:hypothetical protein